MSESQEKDTAMEIEPANDADKKKPEFGPFEMDKDLDEKIAAATAKADVEGLKAAEEDLLALERASRLAAAAPETTAICIALVRLYRKKEDWKGLGETVVLLSKRRSQLKQAVTRTVQEAITYLDEAPDEETKLNLLETLRDVTSGKIYVELERARLTRTLAGIKEEKGDIDAAADIMQELQVETFGAMERREKFDFIMEQVRLCIAKKDFVRAGIIANKIIPRQLDKGDLEDMKVRYYALMIRLHARNKKYLEICRAYLKRFESKTCQDDEASWPRELKIAVLFLVLSPFDNLQSDLMANVRGYKKLEKLPTFASQILKKFATKELIRYPQLQIDFGDEIKAIVQDATTEMADEELDWEDALQERITEHNLRVVATYYSKIGLQRLSQLLDLGVDDTERKLAALVSDKKALWARVDRPANIVTFSKPKSAESSINQWVANVSDLLDVVERTCHLVHKEVMLHKAEA
eukprot:Plantae.Rhodophyta-Hildenbrandia_rubra.ctg52.p2 GENE.Plantae.Rhodophyta-Hildenbrandia_rubra.ctg52~~Plantae.Rhodophyta-Hildenbrandia_rubra.ctg52.p2  ORF type:complete len:467 (-),score=113.63 Plantae.Rhodophyta-Hildenbrandia_rubra.ctg52:175-1575(-)